jgi:hypothetical protein
VDGDCQHVLKGSSSTSGHRTPPAPSMTMFFFLDFKQTYLRIAARLSTLCGCRRRLIDSLELDQMRPALCPALAGRLGDWQTARALPLAVAWAPRRAQTPVVRLYASIRLYAYGRQGCWQTPSGEKPSSFQLAFRKASAPPISMTIGGTKFTVRGYRDYPGGPKPRKAPTA